MARVFIGLGGNLGNTFAILTQAIEQIAKLPGCEFISKSSFYLSPAWGGVDQDDFINAVIEIQTDLAPVILLNALLDVEKNFGRNRENEVRWGPRSLDCDILLFDDLQINSEQLIVPHPRMTQRAFVLKPLAELDLHLVIAEFGTVSTLLNAVSDQPILKLPKE
jgi:2-amino-4-hydroxy-6-hydroxymethyldihydropteridine diphosphokinase